MFIESTRNIDTLSSECYSKEYQVNMILWTQQHFVLPCLWLIKSRQQEDAQMVRVVHVNVILRFSQTRKTFPMVARFGLSLVNVTKKRVFAQQFNEELRRQCRQCLQKLAHLCSSGLPIECCLYHWHHLIRRKCPKLSLFSTFQSLPSFTMPPLFARKIPVLRPGSRSDERKSCFWKSVSH